MKILHIANDYAPVGGTEYYIYNVCNGLEKKSHKNIIVYGNKHDTTWARSNRKTFFIEGIANFNCSEQTINRALSVAKDEDPDIIYLHIVNNPSLIKKLIGLKPIIQYVHNHNLYCTSGFVSNRFFACSKKFSPMCLPLCLIGNCRGCKPFEAVRRFGITKENFNIVKKINAFIVASEYMKQRLIASGVSTDKIYVIPYFVYPKQVYTQNSVSNASTILFVGRVCKFKGPDYLIKALKYIKHPCKLIIAGEGYYMDYIKKLSRKLKLDKNIEFRGWLTPEELDGCYRQASVVVIPSVWPEPFGIVGIEAMSYAKPVVAFDVGGISEWFKNNYNGFSVPLKDIRALASSINQLIEDDELRKKFGERGREVTAENFSPKRHIDLLEKLFLNLAEPV